MRVLIFHGYLLRGTGSNVYNANLAAALATLGHEVHLLCQDRAPLDLPFVDAAGDWDSGSLRVQARAEKPRCTVYRPDIGGLLPVYVADRYERVEARPFDELGEDELDAYLEANVAAVRELSELVRPDIALANHLVMGPAILARALSGEVPYAVKVHGSALEYTVKPHPRFLPYAREGLRGARCVLVGSAHTAQSLWAAMGDPGLPDRTRLGPPGVDVHAFRPRPKPEAVAAFEALAASLSARPPAEPGDDESAFSRDDAAAGAALARVDPEHDRIVLFVGKLIVSKGIDLLIAAWPLVLAKVPAARLLVVGFGAYRDAALELVAALACGDLAAVRALAEQGRGREGAAAAPLNHLLAFLGRLEADATECEQYLRAAAACDERIVFTGRLEHDELAGVLPACDAMVVPSTFPEAYGMVAAEAAACGVLPVSADHSGLAEVTASLAGRVPEDARAMLSFGVGPAAVDHLAGCVISWLQAPAQTRDATRDALVATARERFSWEGVAEGVIAAARGELDALPSPV